MLNKFFGMYYYYIIDIDDPGKFRAHVENTEGVEIWGVEGPTYKVIHNAFINLRDFESVEFYLKNTGKISFQDKLIFR